MPGKILCSLLAVCLILLLAACGKTPKDTENNPDAGINSGTPVTPSTPSGNGGTDRRILKTEELADGFVWELYSDGELKLSGEGAFEPEWSSYLSQPWAAYGGNDRTDEEYFVYITKLTVTEGITALPEYAFANLEKLTDATLPSTLTALPYRAFYGCHSLERVGGGTGLVTIDEYAFANCEKLESLVLSTALTHVRAAAFSGTGSALGSGKTLTLTVTGDAADWAVDTQSYNTAFDAAEVKFMPAV